MKKLFLVLTAAALLITAAACSFSITTANITNATMATAMDKDGAPLDSITSYSTDAPELIVVGKLNNAPEDTTVTFVWYYEGKEGNRVSATAGGGGSIYVNSSVPNNDAWPTGNYKVEIYVDEREKPDATVEFTVE